MGSEECNSNTSWRTGKLSINSKQVWDSGLYFWVFFWSTGELSTNYQ